LEEGEVASGGQEGFGLRRAAIWSVVIAAMFVIPYEALRIYGILYATPEQAVAYAEEGPFETAEDRQEMAIRVVMMMPILLAIVALALFISLLVPIFLLARIVRYLP
jgi:archaellum biogenesis protein FlaJ (TadC family)